MLMNISTYSQSGGTCSLAKTFLPDTLGAPEMEQHATDKAWYQFVSKNSSLDLTILEIFVNPSNKLLSAKLWSGTCTGLTFIAGDTLSHVNDSSLFISATTLVTGNTYYVEINKTLGSSDSLKFVALFDFKLALLPSCTPVCADAPSCNLVCNGDFEDYTGLPVNGVYSPGQIYLACPWVTANDATPDYFNASAVGSFNVPFNNPGNQLAYLGNAYAGVAVYFTPTPGLREYMKAPLKCTLIAGAQYTLSYAVSLADRSYLTGKLSVVVCSGNPAFGSGVGVMPLPTGVGTHESNTGIISNDTSWIVHTLNFTAIGTEDYIIIGNFDPVTPTIGSISSSYYKGAYVYIDGISITPTNILTSITASPNPIDCGQTSTLSNNLGVPIDWAPTGTLSCNNCSNPIANPLVTTTYTGTLTYCTGCVYTASTTLVVTPPTSNSSGNVSICDGESTELFAYGSAGSYSWLPTTGLSNPFISNPVASPTVTTTYTVTYTDVDGCVGIEQITVTVNPLPIFTISGSFTSCVQSGGVSTPYNAVPSAGAAVAYAWSTDSGASGFGLPVNLNFYPNGGTLTVVATDLVTGCTYTESMYVGSCCFSDVNPIVNLVNSNTTSIPPGTGSVSSGAYTINNKTISINGTFNVNFNLTLEGCLVLMGYNAKIIVDPGKIFIITSASPSQKSHVYACDEMWDGIYVSDPASLVAINNGSTIEDALNAIVSENKGNFRIQSSPAYGNVILNKNYKNFVVKNDLTGSHPGYIRSTTIQCYDGVVGGNPTATSDKLHFPHATERSFMGIEIINVNNITIGIPVATQKNTFDNMDFGINSSNSSLNVFNNDFKNIDNPGAIPKGIECFTGTAICASGHKNILRTINVGNTSAIPFYKNTFTNNLKGIVVTLNMNVNIWKNNFNTIANTGIRLSKNYTNTIVVSQNVINSARVGIDCFDNQSANVTIDNNDIDAGTLVVASGVLAQEIIGGTTIYRITRNTIKNVRYGAFGIGLKNSDISRNDVNLKHTTSPSQECYGIRLANSSLCTVVSNRVFGTNTVDYWVQGISLDLCMSDYVTCNESHNLGTGMFFGGVQTPNTYIAKNLMNNNFRGFVLNFGEVGNQFTAGIPIKPNDNRWTGTYTSGCYTETFVSNGLLSQFFVRIGGLPYNVPSINNCTSGGIPIPFNPISGDLNSLVCTSIFPGGGSPAPKPLLLQIAGDSIVPVAYDVSTRWMLKQSLYQHLKVDPSTISTEPLIAQFQSDYSINNMGKLDDVETVLSDLTTATPSTLASVQTVNNTVAPASDVEINSKWMNNLLIENALTGSDYSASQISDLQILAAKCPYNDGQAVYQARVILSQIEDVEYLNACEIATPGSHSMSPFLQSEELSVYNDFKLFPNPNDGTMNFIYSLKETSQGEMIIFDVTGKAVAKYLLATGLDNQIIINETKLSNGIYFYKVIVDNELKVSDKIVIIK